LIVTAACVVLAVLTSRPAAASYGKAGPPPSDDTFTLPAPSIDNGPAPFRRPFAAVPDEAAIGLLGALLLGIAAAVRRAAD
jgi:hypothetical protein